MRFGVWIGSAVDVIWEVLVMPVYSVWVDWGECVLLDIYIVLCIASVARRRAGGSKGGGDGVGAEQRMMREPTPFHAILKHQPDPYTPLSASAVIRGQTYHHYRETLQPEFMSFYQNIIY